MIFLILWFFSFFLFLVHTMDECRHKMPQLLSSFVLFFGMGIGLENLL
jgi:hypothetical protein